MHHFFHSDLELAQKQRLDLSQEPITSNHNRSYPIIARWRHCLLSCDFPPFISMSLQKSHGTLRGLCRKSMDRREASLRCNFTCGCRCWTVLLYKNEWLLISYLVIFALFYFCNIDYFLIPFWGEETLPPLPPRRKCPWYIYSGYGKYSDPLKFFTSNCYIAAIC